MSKLITGRNIIDRIKDAARAFRGKPARSIQLGIEVKKCSECDRDYCEQCVYKERFVHWMSLPNCNDCLHNSHSSCGVCPKPGEDVRINCPLWEPKKEDRQPSTESCKDCTDAGECEKATRFENYSLHGCAELDK